MNKVFLTVTAFAFGAASGSVAAWYISKKKYEQIIQEEIDSVKKVFANRVQEEPKELEEKDTEAEEEIMKKEIETAKVDYNKIASSYNKTSNKDDVVDPYVISPDEFGSDEEYSIVSLTYHADFKLVDGEGELVDIESTVGYMSLGNFGEYEDDCVHVRNENTKIDYEVLLDPRTYNEVYGPDYD